MSFKDKVVWVTGASSGIGEALAYELSKQGALVIVSARRTQELERVKSQCAMPEKVLIAALDLGQPKDFSAVVNAVWQWQSKLDLIIHNGGISQRSMAKDTELEVDRKLIEINYLGTVGLTKAILPYYFRQGYGHFAVVTSLVGKFGSPLRSGYAGSKHALHGFFDSLRAEVFKDNIGITMVCPGFIRTNISMNALVGDGRAQNSMDEKTDKGLDPNVCAQRILKGIAKGKQEVLVGKKEIYAVYLKRFFPSLFASILNKAKVT
ncbi:MAG: SDR family oxidoreductase [Chitinophagales bacterium]|nr:SDR family oxidoreductase [Chitinophagales bacterium]